MTEVSQPASIEIPYNSKRRRISINRIFQIPQMFRPAVSLLAGETIGRLNLERPAVGLTAIANWFRFAMWRRAHPIARPADKKFRKDRRWLYQGIIEREELDSTPVDFWEFGVFRGESLFWWTTHLVHSESRFVGFDTFTGLPERWRATEAEGAFNVYGRLPETRDARVSFQVGLFQDTLLPLVKGHDFSKRLIVHLDADLFTSTLFVLTTLARHFKRGDVIFFDNFICSVDEFRAFDDFVKSFRVKYEVLGGVGEYIRVCVKML